MDKIVDSCTIITQDSPTKSSRFSATRSLKRKRDDSSQNLEIKFFCDECDFKSKSKSNLTKHKKVKHSPEGQLPARFVCTFEGCEKKFTTIDYLRNHEKTHQDRSVSCPHCFKIYINKYALKSHIDRVHNQVKKVSCDFCSKKFLTNQEKTSHMDLVHRADNSSVKQHKCEFCTLTFYTAKKLKTHIERVHERVEKVPCKYEGCTRMFTCTDTMNQHYQYEHQEAKFSCKECEKVFKTKQHLHTHEYYIHKIPHPKIQNEIVKNNLRSRVRAAIKSQCGNKAEKTMKLVGCSVVELRKWLENQFVDGMTWENYGKWHIDHIKPCSKYDLTLAENQKLCFHFTNLQPLWGPDNLKKGSSYDSDEETN